MLTLHRKLLRDVLHLRGQVLAIATVVFVGVVTIVLTRTSYRSLVSSLAAYYDDYRFADVFAQVKRAPESLAREIGAIPGVALVETRIVAEVVLDVPGLPDPAIGRLVSIPDRAEPALNAIHLRRGRRPEPGRFDEVVVSEAFAQANTLDLGDTLGAVINGRWRRLTIAGVGISPEYVYEIRGVDLFPDNRRFGVLWMSRDALAPAFDLDGAFNDVSLRLAPGADETEVIARIDRLIERYGGRGAFGRNDVVSHRLVSDEIGQNRVTGVVVPGVFLGIAAFLLNIVLSRLVATQREQIAALKAFGYSDWAVGVHYFELALVALSVGAVPAIPVGLWLASRVNQMYQRFYRFPVFQFDVEPAAIALGVAVTAIAAGLGALVAVRRAVALPPAEAMRPEAPPLYSAGWMERLAWRRWLGLPARMVLRNLARRPARAALSVFGIALAGSVLVVGHFFLDSIMALADVQFRQVQRENLTVLFREPMGPPAANALARMDGVLRVEPFRSLPARLRHEHRDRRIGLLGLAPGNDLRRLVERSGRAVPLPPEGVMLTAKLGEILGVSVGDTLTVEILEGARRTAAVSVAGFVDELLGLSAYMDVRALNRLAGEGPTWSGAFLLVDPLGSAALFAQLKRTPGVAGVGSRDAALASFEATLQQNIGLMTTILVGCAVAIAFAMVYNSARIALSERGRELASLRVLGFTKGETAGLLLGEQALLTLVAVPLGLGLGYGFCAVLAANYQWEFFRLPLVLTRATYTYAAAVVLGAATLSAFAVRARLNRFDLVSVLKTRE